MRLKSKLDIPKAVMDRALGYIMASDTSNTIFSELKKKCEDAGLNIDNVLYSIVRKYDVSDEVFGLKSEILALDAEIDILLLRKSKLIDQLQTKCKHRNIIEYKDKDKGLSFFKRGCIDCFLTEVAKKEGSNYVFQSLAAGAERSILQINKAMFYDLIQDLKKMRK